MSFNSEYLKLAKKRKKEQEEKAKKRASLVEDGKKQVLTGVSLDDYDDDDISPIAKVGATLGEGIFEFAHGGGNLIEGITDWGMYRVADVADLFGADDFADNTRKQASGNFIDDNFDEFYRATGMRDASVLPEFGADVMQGLGQLGVTYATGGLLGAAGVGAKAVSASGSILNGLSSWGSGQSEAYQGGATDEEALKYGAWKGAIDAGTEMLFGGLGKGVNMLGYGKGLSNLDDVAGKGLAKLVTSKISNDTAKIILGNGIEYAVKSGAEGLEELLASYATAEAKHKTYQTEKDIGTIIEEENPLKNFLVGTAVSAVAQGVGGDVHQANKNRTDLITGLTLNEQRVVDGVLGNRLAEQEKSGEKVKGKDKTKLYNEIIEDLESGGLSIGDIESVLGGDTYNHYNELQNNLDTLLSERNAKTEKLNELKSQPIEHGAQRKRIAKLESQIENLNTQITESHKKLMDYLKDSSSHIAKDSVLLESYKERVRQDQKIEVDLNQYDGDVKEYFKNLMEKGQVNNTNKAKRFWVDLVPKVIKEKGVKVTSTTTKEIYEMEAEKHGWEYVKKNFIDAKVVPNAYILDDGTIALNVNSPNSRKAFFGHELGHTMEKHADYGKLQEILFSYAQAKEGDAFKTRKATVEGMYKGIDGAKADVELTNDLLGKYVFDGDKDFFEKLSVENRGLLKTLWDELKYLYKLATAGSKEKRDLARAEHMVAEIYRESGKVNSKTETKGKTESKGKTDYSLSLVDSVQPTTEGWQRTLTTDEVKERFPNLWDVSAEDSDVRNPTQVTSTVKSYRHIYDYLENEGFDGTILDASSGLGYGTKAGIEEYGFDVEDIEPFPDKDYNPKYRDYSTLDKKYDVVISNAVLNVLPQDQRDALVTKMGELLNDGGRMFINVRGDDVKNASSKVAINEDLMEYYISKSGSYQKGFTPNELKAYLEDVLGDGFTVEKTRMFGKVSAVVTKNSGVQYSLSKAQDGKGKTLFTGSPNTDIRQFKVGGVEGSRQSGDRYGRGVYLTTNENTAKGYAGENGRVYEINADELNVFNLNDTITEEMRESLLSELEIADKQYRNSILRHFRSEKTFTDFDSASAFMKEQRAIWKEQDGLYDANKPITLDVDYENGTAVIEYTDFNNLENTISNLTGNQLYDALKSISTDDFSSFITGNGYDGISFDEGDGNQQYVIYKNEDKLRIENPTSNPDIRYSLSSMGNTFYGDATISVDAFTDYKQTQGYNDYVEKCVNNMRQTRADFDEASARQEIEKAIDGIVRVAKASANAGYDIKDDASKRDVRDSKNRLLFSSLEPNSEYFTSNDISTICDKRKNFAEIYEDIVRAEEAKGVPKDKRFFNNVDNYFYLHKLMADKGLTQPCRQCYVESMRKNLAPMANAFLELVQETNPDNKANAQLYQQKGKNKGNPKTNNASTREWVISALSEYGMSANDLTIDTLTTEDGLAQLKIQAPMVYEAFNSFYGQSKPKMPKSATPFRFGELTALLTDENGKIKPQLIERINSTGGFRLQSYSDFQIENFTDTLQVLFEASTLGLSGHAYTKVPAFLDATEGTNLKRNISIFMYKDGDEWKLDRNDSFPYSLEEIYDIVNADESGNTSIIAVSQNDDMSAWIMANDYVGQGIPFHKSGNKMGTVRDTDVKTEDGRIVKGYSGTIDHTRQQTEVWAETTDDHKKYTKVKKGINIYENGLWDFDNVDGLTKNELIENNITAYLNACEDAGYLPKFRNYVTNNDKILNATLEYAKKLGFAPQDATIADISFEYKDKNGNVKYRVPYGYYKFLGDFGMFTPDGQASPHKTLSLENYDFDKAVDFFKDAETLKRNEILQQFANGEEREYYRNSNLTAGELKDVVSQKRSEIADSVVNRQFSLSKNTDHPVRGAMSETAYTPLDYAPIREDVATESVETVNDTVKTTNEAIDDNSSPVTEQEANALAEENLNSLNDADAPPIAEAPIPEKAENTSKPNNPFEKMDYTRVGSTKEKSFMETNPDVKPYFQEMAQAMLGDLRNSIKGQRWYNDRVYYESNGENGLGGVERSTTADIADLLDGHYHYTYQQIDDALNSIIEGEHLNACAKRIEFALNDRLMNGYTDVYGNEIPANQDYINLLNQMQTAEDISQQGTEAVFTDADVPTDFAPVRADAPKTAPKPTEQKTETKTETKAETEEKVEQIRRENPKDKKGSWWSKTKKKINDAITLVGDKGWAIENLSKKTGNRKLEAKYDFFKNRSQGMAQEYINDNLLPIYEKIEKSGKRDDFDLYAYHLHNIDRMSLETSEETARRAELKKMLEGYTEKQIESIASERINRNTPQERIGLIYLAQEYVDLGGEKGKNKAVFGESVTADVSRQKVAELEANNPEFAEWEKEILAYNKALRDFAVKNGLISQKTADRWAEMYPHYVPIHRIGKDGASVSVPLDTRKTGVNNPFKRAEGGNSDFEPLLETMARNTEQLFRAVNRNSFGVELMNTLKADSTEGADADVSDILEDVEENDGAILKKAENGKPASFTVFVNGKRVEFDITEDIYNALKPTNEFLSQTYTIPNKFSEGYKKLLTEYNPVFSLWRNPIKDSKDVIFNSQHALKTYLTAPETFIEMTTNGKWMQEYVKNGGERVSYYDSKKQTFTPKPSGAKKVVGFPVHAYKTVTQKIEQFWRLSEYIASRKEGKSIEESMLDSARVTTNFGAGGDLTKWANRNGALFLNPSVQGAMQIARNVREAHHKGAKGYAILAGKVLAMGLGGMLVNHLLWEDDEEYEELSDYVKQNYFVIAKTEDGQFIRIPKGRMEAVIQNGFEQLSNLITGDDDVDMETFAELVFNNLAPNNPFENNLLSPIQQVMNNETWYGEDLIPSRLQDLPANEQYDESTDSISKWVGETFNYSPYKFNYLLQQYGGGLADMILPMLTPEAESGDDSLGGNLIAPWRDEMITDSVMKNQNVSDFYTLKDELTVNANASTASDYDILASKYINSVNSEIGELYAKKREIQNSNLSDSAKYNAVRELQKQINALAEEAINAHQNVRIEGNYATVGDRHYRLDDGTWTKISDKQLERQNAVTEELGISPSEYWSKTDISFMPKSDGEYEYAYDNPEKYTIAKAVGGYDAYRTYSKELYNIKADKDSNGKTISGSRKNKVIEYINNLDADYGEKIILYKSEYPSDDTYNYDIVEYLNSRDDISYEDMVTILKELGFTVDSKGNISW